MKPANGQAAAFAGHAASKATHDQAAEPDLPYPSAVALPKAPVLGWGSFWPPQPGALLRVADLPHRVTTSGRAALLAALRLAAVPPGSGVLVPSYHCPTMVAPVVQAGLKPLYFPLDTQGLPRLDAIEPAVAAQARVMFVAQYFGLPQGLQAALDWCEARGILLVEDCAHSFFGHAGSRPVGQWGHYAIASLSKFFPVAEAGLVASARLPIPALVLHRPSLRWQVKGLLDVLQHAHAHSRFRGPSNLVAPLARRIRDASRDEPALPSGVLEASAEAAMQGADMSRASQGPSLAARMLFKLLPEQPIVRQRQANFLAWHSALLDAPGSHGLLPGLPSASAPYVYPLWVDGAERADRVYASLRQARLPVFRWDRVWPGTPADPTDTGSQWSRHLLQLLCHQSLSSADIAQSAQVIRRALNCN
jgi:perosamine synthetase